MAAPVEDLVDKTIYKKYGIPYGDKWYSGYLPIDDAKAFHYFYFPAVSLAQATSNGGTPVILWLNGGPGCSSVFGALNENGPFTYPYGESKFVKNEYAWTNFVKYPFMQAEMFYLESPAQVGFSYGSDVSSDDSVAVDNLKAVQEFFKKFPELKGRDFYISGESYAGTYIPMLADQIIDYNVAADTDKINLKGVLIGNGCTDPTECTIEAKRWPYHKLEFLAKHNFISAELSNSIAKNKEKCTFSTADECKAIYAQTAEEVHGSNSYWFNPYNVYSECIHDTVTHHDGTIIPRSKVVFDPFEDRLPGTVADCDDAGPLTLLLTTQEIRTALHIPEHVKPWAQCTSLKYTKDPRATYHLYPKLIKSGLKILIFSGDIDGVVPINGSLFWIDKLQKELGLQTLQPWRPWSIYGKYGDVQNAGNVWKIDGLTFVSIRNAGHMVPMDRPEAASVMASYFINDADLPSI